MSLPDPLVAPVDAYDRALVAHTHPSDWKNPEAPRRPYPLVVIGGDTAGLVTAAAAASLGARVALVERHLLGGDCLVSGCVPSKGVIAAARRWHAVETGRHWGAPPHVGSGDFAASMARMRRLRSEIAVHDSADRFSNLGVDVWFGEARFIAADAIDVDGVRLPFGRAVIATGARASVPPISGLAQVGYLTNDTIFSLTELPRRLGVLGGGPIGCELAQAFARFGSDVVVIDQLPRILARDDAEAAEVVRTAMARDGVGFRLGATVVAAKLDRGRPTLVLDTTDGREELSFDKILVATGRTPNVDGIGLEAAGIAYDRGGIRVDERLRTTNPKVFACGDVASNFKFTHAADALARIVVQNALFPVPTSAAKLVIPATTYTDPELASVGLTAAEASERGIAHEVVTVPLSAVDRMVLEGTTEGFLRVVTTKRGRILGATLVGPGAGDVIGELVLAMQRGISLGALSAVVHPYPTLGEIVRKAGDTWRRDHFRGPIRSLVRAWIAVARR